MYSAQLSGPLSWQLRCCPARNQDCAGDLQVFRSQAVRVYSLIRPPRRGFWRICCVPTSVTGARGAAGSSSGMCWVMPWCGGPCCRAPGTRSGRRADALRRGSARGRGALGVEVPSSRSQSAFIGGAWTAVRKILVPAASKTASNKAVRFDPRSRFRNLMSANRSSRATPAEERNPRPPPGEPLRSYSQLDGRSTARTSPADSPAGTGTQATGCPAA